MVASPPETRTLARAAHVAAITAFIVLLKGYPVPHRDEWVYAIGLSRFWNPDLLRGDWTFAAPFPEHFLFNAVFGVPALVLSIGATAWIGRLLAWTLTSWLLFRLGERFEVPRWTVTGSLALWILYGQAHLAGGDWMIGELGPKSFAYVLALVALLGFLAGRTLLPALFAGLAFSFHAAVGLWAGVGMYGALLASGRPWSTQAKCWGITLAAAAPGAIAVVPTVLGGAVVGTDLASADDRRFLIEVAWRHLLDPFAFPRGEVILVVLMLAFNVLHLRRNRDSETFRFLVTMQGVLFVAYALGFGFRAAGMFGPLKLFPFRLFPLFALLYFFLALAHGFFGPRRKEPSPAMVVVGLVAVLSFGSPIKELTTQVGDVAGEWRRPDDAYTRAFRWVATSLPEDAIVIAPPWRIDSFYVMRRGQVASWLANRNDLLGEWRRRIEALCGPVRALGVGETWPEYLRSGYDARTNSQIEELARRYAADYLVGEADRPFPVVHAEGTCRVYDLRDVRRGTLPR